MPVALYSLQDICFLTNGDPPAWLPSSLDLELALGLELLEMVLRSFPIVFVKVHVHVLVSTVHIHVLWRSNYHVHHTYVHVSAVHIR